jgi:hypothetical protein
VHATELGDGLVIRRLRKSIGNLRLWFLPAVCTTSKAKIGFPAFTAGTRWHSSMGEGWKKSCLFTEFHCDDFGKAHFVRFSEQNSMRWKSRQLCCYIPIVSSAPDVLLLLGMLMLGMALGSLLTHIRHKTQIARIVQELEARFGFKAESGSMIRQSLTLPHKAHIRTAFLFICNSSHNKK